ncbi:MAG: NFACT family protein [Clostridia bacterium]|nr:NFACT family protein [Clostridia bacterium]
MAYDACMMRAVLSEIEAQFIDAKVERVLQPQQDELDLVLRSRGETKRLVFNVGPNAPRMQLSAQSKENPLKAPMFCMQMRKHLGGARLLSVEQPGFDRIAKIHFSAYDEMGYPTSLCLICEIMGKYANLILANGEGKIVTAMKLIDFSASTIRQVLPGMTYRLPESQGKLSPLEAGREDFFTRFTAFPKERTVEKFITQSFSGIATQISHELCFRASGTIDLPLLNVDAERLWRTFSEWQDLLLKHDYLPTVVYNNAGKPSDNSYMDITYLGTDVKKTSYRSLAEMFDAYFAERDRLEKIHQRGKDVLTLVQNAISRTEKKIALQKEALLESERAVEFKRYGDLITANIYKMKRGDEVLVCVDYYDENCPEVEIKLDTRLSPAQNAQRMYKHYTKQKNAKETLTALIGEWEGELRYLESVADFLSRATTEEDLLQIRDELYHSGYASRMKGYQPGKISKQKPLEYVTSSGYRLLVGRNNAQNDYLTFKVATKGDLWFHAKDMPGSHAILLCDGEEPDARDYTEAAAVAAYHSSGRDADLLAVDYTRVKNIKKPQGAKSGFVIYKTNYTAYVKPAASPEKAETRER